MPDSLCPGRLLDSRSPPTFQHPNAPRIRETGFHAFSGRATQQPPRMLDENDPVLIIAGTDREAIRRVRITQHLFRQMVLSGYKEQCAVCTLPARELLVASHIVGWAVDERNRMNPRNGICLCSLHDRAFDTGLMDVDEEYRIHVTPRCMIDQNHPVAREMLYGFEGASLTLPERWLPDPSLLARRRELLRLSV